MNDGFDANETRRRSGEEGEHGTKKKTTFLCQCDSVVFQKDDFQAVAHHRIVVDHLADGCDQADDHLGCVVSGGSLGGGARR